MCFNIIAVVGALFRRWSLGVNFQQSPVAVPSYDQQQLSPPWDSWSLGVDSQQRSAVSNPLFPILTVRPTIGPPWDSRSLGVNFQQSPADVSDCKCEEELGSPWDSWSLGVKSQQRSVVSDPEDEDNSEMIIYREIAELCVELNLPPENLTIDHSDWGLPEILSHLKKLKANKEAGQPSSQLSIHFIYEVPEELLPLKQKKANKGKNILFSAIRKISKRFK
ncbi:hypothetical protein LOK49_LG10G02179 [Camellia lanceoleosa]|uniref:Uncharacterized protein n=1 Tax=Camellia lanceoleosa TaxID=1840588 RepID=A0ACC0GC69_9ERIC|nr:hypothetical protein LOK49_LG10G02179 [Camellia lanceoleosa]